MFTNKRITVMGLGCFGGGIGVSRFLVNQGAFVTVTDLRNEGELSSSLKQLEGLPIVYRLGGHHDEDFIHADMVIVNPAVPENSRFLQIALNNRVSVETEINIFFALCPAPIIGVTGSNGKSTTTGLIGTMLGQTSRRVWIGGNIGKSLLTGLEEIKPQDIVVLELSSFQLKRLSSIQRSPHVSAITNLSPNHLDRHSGMDDYIQSKKNIILYQHENDYAVINYDDPELRKWEDECRGRILWYSTKEKVRNGVFVENDDVVVSLDHQMKKIACLSAVKMPGIHNIQNILAASGAAYLAGAEESHIGGGIAAFTGLEHRLEFVSVVHGIQYFNDSKATTPESAIAAIRAFREPVILIAGGGDKGSDFDEFASVCVKCTKAIILMGTTAKKIYGLIQRKMPEAGRPLLFMANTLNEAFHRATTVAKTGDVILLSPACASYDMFQNYEERGRQFKQLVQAL
ncbi:MAG: UDP-N-acetylmuramoyl-L-alanine--D-glutamate ligase [Candidatus Loosdrechtia sp.]|uniref:UDP-N-acetylmuramoyl-L-alanine--D-glutamate ligase n=1 Tax=Candidatus Loosdrechtia sp. TaxID=3101272 RepID=UPI00403B2B7E